MKIMLIKIILGSTRDGRAGEHVAKWVEEESKKYQGTLSFEMIDLKEVALPFMNEPISPMASSDYKYNHTKLWSKTIQEADGFIMVTPEYNHGYSAVLKNALDYLYQEWQNKPVGFVGYGGSGARSSIKQLRSVVDFMNMKTMDHQVGIEKIWAAFDDQNQLKKGHITGDIHQLFTDLETNLTEKRATS